MTLVTRGIVRIVPEQANIADLVTFNLAPHRIKARTTLPAKPKFPWGYRFIVKF